MLVFTRKVGETIRIGENIEITVTAVEGNKVRLGFMAPPSVEIWRSELWDRSFDDLIEPVAYFLPRTQIPSALEIDP